MDSSTLTTQAKVSAIDDRTPTIRLLTLAPETPMPFRAGQYILVGVAEDAPRPFSIANAPAPDGHITLHIRNTGTGLSHKLGQLAVGDTVTLIGPYGVLDAARAKGRPVIMVAGGTGVAPMLALAHDMLSQPANNHDITMIFGFRDALDVYCTPELVALEATGHVTVLRALGDDTPDKTLAGIKHDLSDHTAYICGPAAMVQTISDTLKARMVDAAHIHYDRLPERKP